MEWRRIRSIGPIGLGHVAFGDRLVLPHAPKLGRLDIEDGEIEEIERGHLLGEDALGLAQELVALVLIGGGYAAPPRALNFAFV